MLQSEPDVFALSFVYFFMIIAMNTFLLLGLFVAVVTGTFARVRQQHGSAFLSHEDDEVLSAYDQSPRKSSRGASRGGGFTTTSEAKATKKGQLIYHPQHAKRGKGQMAMYLNDDKEEKEKEEDQDKLDEVRVFSLILWIHAFLRVLHLSARSTPWGRGRQGNDDIGRMLVNVCAATFTCEYHRFAGG
jgi:hypothetical protein